MIYHRHLAACLLLGLAAASLHPDIRADTNRDGLVDIDGDSDVDAKAIWTDTRGAIFLPNVGDKYRRCPREDLAGIPLSDSELAACNDASGDYLLAPEYVAPLRTVPMVNISDSMFAHIYATPRAASERVRIFVLEDEADPEAPASWAFVDPQLNFNASQLRAGLILGIDGREFVTDSQIWDGTVTINFNVHDLLDPATNASDAVALKVAPILTHHPLQPMQQLITAAATKSVPAQPYFIEQLDAARESAGIEAPLLLLKTAGDIWAQDILEPAYASMPGPNGAISLRIMLRSAQGNRDSARQLFEQLRGPGVGVWQPSPQPGNPNASDASFAASGQGSHPVNALGNLETTPPYTSTSGVTYKAGRIIQGTHFDQLPAQSVRSLIAGQGVQNTLYLEAGWLKVGHVDEFVQFVPYDNSLGFTIAIASPDAALRILRETQTQGHGHTNALSYDPNTQTQRPFFQAHIPSTPIPVNLTVDALLADPAFLDANTYAQTHLAANLAILLAEIPLAVEDIIHVPVLYHDPASASHDSNSTPEFNESTQVPPYSPAPPVPPGEHELLTFYPSAVNGIVLGSQSGYIAPNPFGPVVDGVDVIRRGVEAAYARAGMGVIFIDDFYSHHLGAGDVHCGSNALRAVEGEWWV
ncbi:protein-arginine deiminase domain-containing protein [Aspergillus mulundensis]|uniref:Protein-arginine deiminase C-terminal domain-containing protein n=1 Tax=Aspergillus mulundensis TaxID=1810919 RepID=A0A3D8QN10_9EURO|nr:Uncharacterized protein DSM5745_10151 [Aspergillus mulundensis]RDW63040.1 Uncharacterized protein DSM5745_10151 [Aspergillus mulundensis]